MQTAFVISFIFLWVSVIFLISKKSGWCELAKKYGKFNPLLASGIKLYLGYGRINGIFYKNCLLVGSNENGVLLKLLFPFSLFNPLLFIPRSEIEKIEEYKSDNFIYDKIKVLRDRYVRIKIKSFPGMELLISKELAEESGVEKNLID